MLDPLLGIGMNVMTFLINFVVLAQHRHADHITAPDEPLAAGAHIHFSPLTRMPSGMSRTLAVNDAAFGP